MNDCEIIRKVNSCIDFSLICKLLTNEEWNRFIELVNDKSHTDEKGKSSLVFSGDPTGFHLLDDKGVIDCGV